MYNAFIRNFVLVDDLGNEFNVNLYDQNKVGISIANEFIFDDPAQVTNLLDKITEIKALDINAVIRKSKISTDELFLTEVSLKAGEYRFIVSTVKFEIYKFKKQDKFGNLVTYWGISLLSKDWSYERRLQFSMYIEEKKYTTKTGLIAYINTQEFRLLIQNMINEL